METDEIKELINQLEVAAMRSAVSADNGNYLCAVTINQARAAASALRFLLQERELVQATSAKDLSPNGQLHAAEREAEALRSDMKTALARISELETALAWQPIKTVPNYTEVFMAYQGNGSVNSPSRYGIGQYSGSPEDVDGKQILWNWGWAMPPTHWMAIPVLETASPQREGDRPVSPPDQRQREP